MADAWDRPHTVSVGPLTQASFDGTKMVGNPVKGAAQSVKGDLQERAPGKFLEQFGLAFDNPAVLYIDPADASKFPPSAIVTLGSRRYWVVAKARVDEAGDELDGAVVPLQRMDFPR